MSDDLNITPHYTEPKMILFDYGQTLADEKLKGRLNGTRAVLENCVHNPLNITAEEVQEFADRLNGEIGRYNPQTMHLYKLEVHNHMFQKFLYEYFDLKSFVSPYEMEKVFWDNFSHPEKTKNIDEFLVFLDKFGIRTGVISNIGFSEKTLTDRINRLIPENKFEFIIASSEYIFRKPCKLIFEIALKKAGLEAKDVWYCGDNIIWDVEGAKSCGISPVLYSGASEKFSKTELNSEYLMIHDWLELIPTIEKLRDCETIAKKEV